MINKENIKNLAKYLSQELKSKEVKNSELLELMAKFNGYKDWNTFSAVMNDSVYNPTDLNWSQKEYVHVDNGGYEFSYNDKRKLLYINTGFFGYSSNEHIFHLSKSELRDLVFDLKKMANIHDQVEETENNDYVKKEKWIVDAFSINFLSSTTKVVLMRNKSKKIIKILEDFILN